MEKDDRSRGPDPREGKRLPYEPPRITAYDVPTLTDMIGPAGACIRWDPMGAPPPRPGEYEDELDEDW